MQPTCSEDMRAGGSFRHAHGPHSGVTYERIGLSMESMQREVITPPATMKSKAYYFALLANDYYLLSVWEIDTNVTHISSSVNLVQMCPNASKNRHPWQDWTGATDSAYTRHRVSPAADISCLQHLASIEICKQAYRSQHSRITLSGKDVESRTLYVKVRRQCI